MAGVASCTTTLHAIAVVPEVVEEGVDDAIGRVSVVLDWPPTTMTESVTVLTLVGETVIGSP